MSMIIRKPLALYFTIDLAYLYGDPREFSKRLFNSKGLFMWFQLFNLLFVVRIIYMNSLKAFLLLTYGVEGYDKVIIYMNINGWIFSGLIIMGYFFINKKVKQYLKQQTGEIKGVAVDSNLSQQPFN